MATKKARWNDALEMVHDYPDMQVLVDFRLLGDEIALMHNDVTRLDAREECWS
jgi:hypothetical protein